MHEITVMMEVARIVDDLAKENGIKHVEEIVLEIGEVSGIISIFMDEYFPVVTSDKPVLEGCKLRFIEIKAVAVCDDCGEQYNLVDCKGVCPKCGSEKKKLLCGKEFNIKEISVRDDE